MKQFKHVWFSVDKEQNRVVVAHETVIEYYSPRQAKEGVTPDEAILMLGNNGWQMCGVVNDPFYCMYYFVSESTMTPNA